MYNNPPRVADCDDERAADRSFGRLLDAVALGAVLVLAWRACHGRHHHRRRGRSACAPADVEAWEAEGGRPLPSEHVTPTAHKPA